jgi:hypothetical protein
MRSEGGLPLLVWALLGTQLASSARGWSPASACALNPVGERRREFDRPWHSARGSCCPGRTEGETGQAGERSEMEPLKWPVRIPTQ